MIRTKVKKNPLLLLIFLIGFAFLAIKIFSKDSVEVKQTKVDISQPQQCDSCNNQNDDMLMEQLIENISDDDVVYIKKASTVDITDMVGSSSVKGVKQFECGNISANTLLASIRKTCSKGAGPVDFSDSNDVQSGGDGVVVTEDTEVVITEITYPLSLFLGQHTYQDSNKQIKKDSPEYRSNGQQIDVEYVTKNLSPKESTIFSESLESTEKVPFKVEAEVKLGGADSIESSTPGQYTIRNAPHNPGCKVKGEPCDRKLAISDFNVEKTNRLASDSKYGGYLTAQAPGGDKYEREEETSCLVEHENYTYWDKGVINACKQGALASIKAKFKATFSGKKWKRCTVGEEVTDENGNVTVEKDTCVDLKDIGIKMTAIFGDPYECTEDLCANAMLVDRYRSILSPKQAGGTEEVSGSPNKSLTKFVATDCKITIDGKAVDVYCLWDSSVYLLNYQLQAKDAAPNQKDFPQSFNSYWGSVKRSSDISSEQYGLD